MGISSNRSHRLASARNDAHVASASSSACNLISEGESSSGARTCSRMANSSGVGSSG